MPVYRLDERLVFPPPQRGPRRGPIAVGGDLRPARLLLAYSMGIFPWQGDPLHWHSPDPRMVLLVEDLRVSRSLAKTIRRGVYRAHPGHGLPRRDDGLRHGRHGRARTVPGSPRAWSTRTASCTSAESPTPWRSGSATPSSAGSTASRSGRRSSASRCSRSERDASKVAFVRLVEQLRRWKIPLVDCQVHTPHLALARRHRVAARPLPRGAAPGPRGPTRLGPWRFDATGRSERQRRGEPPGAGRRAHSRTSRKSAGRGLARTSRRPLSGCGRTRPEACSIGRRRARRDEPP